MSMFHAGTKIQHWLELWTGTGTEFLRLENVLTCYRTVEGCWKRIVETIKRLFVLENCYRIFITVTLKGIGLNW
jgi:hypothetical protein